MYVASDHPPRGTACAPRGRGSPDLAMRHPPASTGGPTDHTRSGSARHGARLPPNSWSSVQFGGTVKSSVETFTISSMPLYHAASPRRLFRVPREAPAAGNGPSPPALSPPRHGG